MRKMILTNVRFVLTVLACGLFIACCNVCFAEGGTAFAITSDGIYVTCAHLFRDMTEIKLRGVSTYSASVLAVDAENDLALLKAYNEVFKDNKNQATLEPLTGQDYLQVVSSRITPGTKVSIGVFTSYEYEDIVKTGTYSGNAQVGPLDLLELKGYFNFLSDGGPVVDANGGVIGVVRLINKKRFTAIPSEHILALLKSVNIKAYETKPAKLIQTPDHFRKCLTFLETRIWPAVDYGRDQVVVGGRDRASATRIAAFADDHGYAATAKGGKVMMPFDDKRFGSVTLLLERTVPYNGQVQPSLAARVTLQLKKDYWKSPRDIEIIKWANDMQRQFPSLSIYTTQQHTLCIEQALSFSETMTWAELNNSVDSFKWTVTVLSQGYGFKGFKKFLTGFENLENQLAG